RMEVDSAARQAARAASLARDPEVAAAQARATATAALAENRITCDQMSIAVNTADYGPGGTVTVTVQCTTRLADVPMPGLPPRSAPPVVLSRSAPGGGPCPRPPPSGHTRPASGHAGHAGPASGRAGPARSRRRGR